MRSVVLALGVVLFALPQAAVSQTETGDKLDTVPKLNVVGTAHLDTQWRWTIKNTIDEFVPATFRDNFKLMDQYPDYVFSFEGAFRYMLLREYFPDEYAKLRQYITRGQWRVCGSWVDAVDVNVPSFESLVRQVLYGNGYFKREFGVTSRDVFLPDCFGFGYALPSIAAHCGLKSFSTQKLSWGSAYGVPFDIGRWEGVDGSSLVAGIRPGDYVAKIRGDLSRDTIWLAAAKRQSEVSGLPIAYMYFGTGDTGGSPDSLSVDWLHKSLNSDGPMKVASVGADDLVDIVGKENISRLPSYKGELLMTRHGVGCYTSQATMKRWNRKNELLADATERASVIAHTLGALPYPTENLRDTWIRFLWHQFHDDITGTSIPEAYEFSWNDEILCQNRFAGMLTAAHGATSAALDTRAKGVPLVVFNPLSINRQDVVDAVVAFDKKAPAHVRVFGPDGQEVPSQVLARFDDSLQVLFLASVPSVGYAVYDVRPSDTPYQISAGLSATERRLENEVYIVTLNDNGDVASVYDRRIQSEILSQPIVWELFKDKPRQWPAWEIQYEDLQVAPQVLTDSDASIQIIEDGPVRATLEIVRHYGQSTFRTRVSLAAGNAGERLEFYNDVDWYEEETLLKVAFRPSTPSDSVTYDLGLGTIKRGINRPELYEVPGHQWADMTANNDPYGFTVLNDCRYGWDHPDSSTLRLTLIHTPGVFDNWAWVGDQSSQDLGHHTFGFAVRTHEPLEQQSGNVWQAARFNQPLIAFQTEPHKGTLGPTFSFVQIYPMDMMRSLLPPCPSQVMVTAVKKAEDSDELIVRLRELCGIRTKSVEVAFPWPISSARELDGAENEKADAEFEGTVLMTSLAPFQPRTFAVKLTPQRSKIAPPAWRAVSLVYDMDGISLDSDRLDGDFDSHGYTLAGELLPDTIFNYGVGFVTGSKVAGTNNLISCKGQKIVLPSGDYDHLWLLAASVDGPTEGTFAIGKQTTTTPIQDYATPIGRWNSRLVGGEFMEDKGSIAPAYILREPVGWVGTHRHDGAGNNESYAFTYLFLIDLDVPKGARELTLPDNPRIRVAAATMVSSEHDYVRATQPLYDVANATLATVAAERTDFLDSMVIRLGAPMPGAIVQYTLDGSNPTETSTRYTQPLVLKETATVKARALLASADDTHVTSMTFTKLIPHPAVSPTNVVPGLKCEYYEGEWRRLPNFDSLTPAKSETVTTFAIPDFARPENFALILTGYVLVPKEGLYDFYLDSDDGSALFVGDSLLVDNDGIHGSQVIDEGIALKAGLHPIRVLMFQNKGGEYLEVSMRGPGLEKQPIPARMLFHERE